MFHRRKAIVSDSALRALRFRRRNPVEVVFQSVIRAFSSLLGLIFVLTVSLMQCIDRGLEKLFSALAGFLFQRRLNARPARAHRITSHPLPRLRLPAIRTTSFKTGSRTHLDALLPSDRATKKALMEQTAKIFAERLGADNVVVTSIQQFISREDDAEG